MSAKVAFEIPAFTIGRLYPHPGLESLFLRRHFRRTANPMDNLDTEPCRRREARPGFRMERENLCSVTPTA